MVNEFPEFEGSEMLRATPGSVKAGPTHPTPTTTKPPLSARGRAKEPSVIWGRGHDVDAQLPKDLLDNINGHLSAWERTSLRYRKEVAPFLPAPKAAWAAKVESAPTASAYNHEQNCVRMEIEVLDVIFDLAPSFEPYHCSIAVYDLTLQKKVTESLWFSINAVTTGKPEPWAPRKMSFLLGNHLLVHDLYLIVFVDRVFQGELEPAFEVYSKPKQKEMDQLKASVESALPIYGEYRQSFAWGFFPITFPPRKRSSTRASFYVSPSLQPSYSPVAVGPLSSLGPSAPVDMATQQEINEGVHVMPLLKARAVDESRYMFLFLEKDQLTHKKNVLPGRCVVSVTCPRPEDVGTLYDSALNQLKPHPRATVIAKLLRPYREMESFLLPPRPRVFAVPSKLFVYLDSIDFSREHKSNIMTKAFIKKGDKTIDMMGEEVIQNLWSTNGQLVFMVPQAVVHRAKVPGWIEEIKVKVPDDLDETHHLVFQVNKVKHEPGAKVKLGAQVEKLVGYIILPLLKDGHLISDATHDCQLVTDLKPGYLDPKVWDSQSMMSSGLPIVKIRTVAMSSIHSTEPTIAAFLQCDITHADTPLQEILSALSSVNLVLMVEWLYPVFDRLVLVAGSHPVESLRHFAFESLAKLIVLLSQKAPDSLVFVEEFLRRVMTTPAHCNSNDFLVNLTNAIMATVVKLQSNIVFAQHLGLMLEFLTRSLSTALVASKVLRPKDVPAPKSDGTPAIIRATRFSSALHDAIRELHTVLMNMSHISQCVQSVGVFDCNLLALCDRGFVLSLVHQVMHMESVAWVTRLAYLDRIAAYEHWVPLNLPLRCPEYPAKTASTSTPSSTISVGKTTPRGTSAHSSATTSIPAPVPKKADAGEWPQPTDGNWIEIWRKNHILASELIEAVWNCLSITDKPARHAAIRLMFTLFCRHENEARYSSPEYRSRIASLYLPLVWHLIEDREPLDRLLNESPKMSQAVLASFAWILWRSPPSLLKKWFMANTGAKVVQLLNLVETSIVSLKTPNLPLMKHNATFSAGRVSLMSQLACSAFVIEILRARGVSTRTGGVSGDVVLKCIIGVLMRAFIIGDMLFVPKSAKRDACSVYLGYIASTRLLIEKFPAAIFHRGGRVEDFCHILASMCSLPCGALRNEAIALILLMVKADTKMHSHFAQMKMMLTTAIASELNTLPVMNGNVPASIQALAALASADSNPSGFLEKFIDFCHRLQEIVSSTSEVKEGQRKELDKETIASMMYRTASSYTTAPEMRITWLENLANLHRKHKDHAEAAQCMLVHISVIASLLNVQWNASFRPPLPPQLRADTSSKAATSVVSPAYPPFVLWDSACPGDPVYLNPHVLTAMESNWQLEDHAFDSPMFTEKGLEKHLLNTVFCLEAADMYEAATFVYKPLMRLYERRRDAQKLKNAAEHLVSLYERIDETNTSRSRFHGQFYLVRFYGSKFGSRLDGHEFIYKEPKLARLADIQQRLKEEFGPTTNGNIKFIMKSGIVDTKDLEADISYIQIIAVAPYLDMAERAQRKTNYEQWTTVSSFVFEVPFTAAGPTYGDVHEQQKRKVIKSVSHPFPYLLRRQKVSQSKEEELNPLDNAIETIELQTSRLDDELPPKEKDHSQLQMLLQGSVRLQVNAGPFAMCEAFLSPLSPSPATTPTPDMKKSTRVYSEKDLEKLRNTLRRFIEIVRSALTAHSEVMTVKERPFHDELEKGYSELFARMSPYLFVADEPEKDLVDAK